MGLDQYLHAKNYISSYQDNDKFNELVAQFNANELISNTQFTNAQISFGVGYWRKANAIHGWFVRELAGGVDECQVIRVKREQLETLLVLCHKALADKPKQVPARRPHQVFEGEDVAQALVNITITEQMNAQFNDDNGDPLRPVSGFFFGGTEKDVGYYDDLRDTINIINRALSMGKEWYFTYQASW